MTEDDRTADRTEKTRDAAAPADAKIVRKGVRPSAIVFGLLILAAGGFGLYEMERPPSKNVAFTGACAKSLALAQKVDPLVHGELAALTLATQPNDMSGVAFDDAGGMKTSVAAFKGRTLLLNLWATWCVPCRTEMPSLDRLQAALGSKDFSVVPVDVDTTRLEKARGFLKELGTTHLPYYADSSADILQSVKPGQKIEGLPTTILIGADGCEIGTMAGPAQWDSPEAQALIQRLVKAELEQGHTA